MGSITTLTLYTFTKNKFWAFQQMGKIPIKENEISGLTFFKFLGTGGGKGFSLWPDFNTYAFLGVWESVASFERCMKQHHVFLRYKNKSSIQRTFLLKPIKSHGKWSGINPFEGNQYDEKDEKLPVAVITRATLRWTRLISFWKSVPKAAKAIEEAKGVVFYKGIGEWPFVQQATISVWDNFESVQQFAYHNTTHSKIVTTTRKKKWYQEDLFSRFILISDTISIK